jgi:hypothetical protein
MAQGRNANQTNSQINTEKLERKQKNELKNIHSWLYNLVYYISISQKLTTLSSSSSSSLAFPLLLTNLPPLSSYGGWWLQSKVW